MKNAESVAAILQYHGVRSLSVYRSISVRLVHIGREGVLSVAVHGDIVVAKAFNEPSLGVYLVSKITQRYRKASDERAEFENDAGLKGSFSSDYGWLNMIPAFSAASGRSPCSSRIS